MTVRIFYDGIYRCAMYSYRIDAVKLSSLFFSHWLMKWALIYN